MTKYLPEPELLHKLLRCEPDAGNLFWRVRKPEMFTDGINSAECVCARWNGKHAGKQALNTDSGNGYLTGLIFGKTFKSHRVLWAMVHGEWPPEDIDHINGVTTDNRIVNLRAVSRTENCKNQKMPKRNTSGVMGVNWYKPYSKWLARISVDGKTKHIGYFTDKDAAITAYKAAEIKHGYHPNHGRA